MAKQIIDARIKQKTGTFEEWDNNPLILLDGEVALVRTATGALIQQRLGDGFKTFAELPDNIRYDQSAFISVDAVSKATGNYTVVGAGTYSGVTVGADKIAVLYWNGTAWVKNFEGDLPKVDVVDGFTSTDKTKAGSADNDRVLDIRLNELTNDSIDNIVRNYSNFILNEGYTGQTVGAVLTKETGVSGLGSLLIDLNDDMSNIVIATIGANSRRRWYFVDNSLKVISQGAANGASGQTLNESLTKPLGATKLIVQFWLSNLTSNGYSTSDIKVSYTQVLKGVIPNLIEDVQGKADEITIEGKVVRTPPTVIKNYTEITDYTLTPDSIYVYNTGAVSNVSGYQRQLFTITDSSKKYALTGVINGAALLGNYVMFDEDMVYLGYGERVNTGEIKTYNRFEFQPNLRTKFIGTTNNKGATPMKLESLTETSSFEKVAYEKDVYLKPQINSLIGASIGNIGDSIFASPNSPAFTLTNEYGMFLTSKARGGATVAVIEGRNNDIQSQVDALIAEKTTLDYIILDGLANDIFNSTPLGAISSGYSAVLDKSTFSGGLEYIFKTLKTHFYMAKIVYTKIHNLGNYPSQQSYQDRASEICRKWSIGVVDLYNHGQMNSNLPIMRKTYTTPTESQPDGDGTHLNALGYKMFMEKEVFKALNNF